MAKKSKIVDEKPKQIEKSKSVYSYKRHELIEKVVTATVNMENIVSTLDELSGKMSVIRNSFELIADDLDCDVGRKKIVKRMQSQQELITSIVDSYNTLQESFDSIEEVLDEVVENTIETN
jgi:hypothetical protein